MSAAEEREIERLRSRERARNRLGTPLDRIGWASHLHSTGQWPPAAMKGTESC